MLFQVSVCLPVSEKIEKGAFEEGVAQMCRKLRAKLAHVKMAGISFCAAGGNCRKIVAKLSQIRRANFGQLYGNTPFLMPPSPDF